MQFHKDGNFAVLLHLLMSLLTPHPGSRFFLPIHKMWLATGFAGQILLDKHYDKQQAYHLWLIVIVNTFFPQIKLTTKGEKYAF